MLIEGVRPVRPAFKNIQHILCLLDGVILFRPQDALLLEFQLPAALRKQIAARYKNVRIDAALLLELGQKSFLTGNIRYLLVDLYDVLAPEETAGSGSMEVRDELFENICSIMLEFVIQTKERTF